MEISKSCYMKLYIVQKFGKGGERHQEKYKQTAEMRVKEFQF